MKIQMNKVSIVIPSKNEAQSLVHLLPKLQSLGALEVIIVDDGSDDNTADVCAEYPVVRVHNPYSKGNGAAIKTGARRAQGEVIVFMDADGQHEPSEALKLVETLGDDFDMAVGVRSSEDHASPFRRVANQFYNKFSSWMVSHEIRDLTSGIRAVKADKFKKFMYLLPNGFSYPTTITMAFFKSGLSVAYTDVSVNKRIGESHIRIFRDGVKFLLIILKVGVLYSPLKIFTPISAGLFLLGGANYFLTFWTRSAFTNMSSLLFVSGLVIFLFGLLAEQMTTVIYKD